MTPLFSLNLVHLSLVTETDFLVELGADLSCQGVSLSANLGHFQISVRILLSLDRVFPGVIPGIGRGRLVIHYLGPLTLEVRVISPIRRSLDVIPIICLGLLLPEISSPKILSLFVPISQEERGRIKDSSSTATTSREVITPDEVPLTEEEVRSVSDSYLGARLSRFSKAWSRAPRFLRNLASSGLFLQWEGKAPPLCVPKGSQRDVDPILRGLVQDFLKTGVVEEVPKQKCLLSLVFKVPKSDVSLWTDASALGFGAHTVGGECIQGLWGSDTISSHINVKELLALSRAIESHLVPVGRTICWFTDNIPAAFCVIRKGSNRSRPMQEVMMKEIVDLLGWTPQVDGMATPWN